MATRPATIRPKPLNFPVLDNNPQSDLERTTTVPIFNGDNLARSATRDQPTADAGVVAGHR